MAKSKRLDDIRLRYFRCEITYEQRNAEIAELAKVEKICPSEYNGDCQCSPPCGGAT